MPTPAREGATAGVAGRRAVTCRKLTFCLILLSVPHLVGSTAGAQDEMQLKAVISAAARHVPVGKPVWIDFMLQNLSP